MSTETPTLADVVEMFIHAEMAGHFHAFPGRVVTYDINSQTADIEPMTKAVSRNADDDRVVDTLPVMSGIPVAWPRGGGYFLHLPLTAGDCGFVIISDTDLGAWRDSGQVADPGDERRHALGGAVFYPGLETVARALTVPEGHLVLGKESGPAVHIDDSSVQLGDTGGDPVVIARTGAQGLEAWITAVSSALSITAPVVLKATKAKAT